MRAVFCGLLVLMAACSSEPPERARFDCPGEQPFEAIRDPGVAWINEQGQKVYPAAECRKTALPRASA